MMKKRNRIRATGALPTFALLAIAITLPVAAHAQSPADPPRPPRRVVIVTEGGAPAALEAFRNPADEILAMAPQQGAAGGMDGMEMPGAHGLKALDRDHDGKISKKEAKAAREEHFRQLDADHDGKVTADEIVAFHERQRRERQKKMAARMLKRFDKNGDGVVSSKEFDAFFSRRFARADADHDGTVTREEMARAMRERMRHLRREMQRLRREMRRMGMRMMQMWMHDDDAGGEDVEVIIDHDE